jgi:hypothetical protein
VDCEVSGQLCVADRQFLMLQLGSRVAEDQVWLQPECNNCQQPFDLGMQRSAIPVQPAGPGYPYTQVLLGNRLFKLRVPTGKDQEMIATLDGEDALRILVKRCIVCVDGMAPNEDLVAHLSLKDISKLEAAIEAVSPMTATRINTRCPECGHPQAIALDLYEIAGGERMALYEDVHRLAFQYHWNEAEILALPRERRKLYLALLDRARGVYN